MAGRKLHRDWLPAMLALCFVIAAGPGAAVGSASADRLFALAAGSGFGEADPTSSAPAPPATRPALVKPELFVVSGPAGDGTSTTIWLGSVQARPGAPAKFIVLAHDAAKKDEWRQLSTITGVPEALAAERGEATVLLADGRCLSLPQVLYKPDLPKGASYLAVAGSPTRLWALGMGDPSMLSGLPTTTQPTTRPSVDSNSAASRPITRPSVEPAQPPRPILFRQERDKWIPVAAWPEPAPPGAVFSMAVTIRASASTAPATRPSSTAPTLQTMVVAPVVAWVDSASAIRVFRLTERGWESLCEPVRTSYALRRFKLISLGDRAVLWTVGEAGPGQLWPIDGSEKPVSLALHNAAPAAAMCDLTYALGQYHFFYKQNTELFEQLIKPDGTPGPEAALVRATRPPQEEQPLSWVSMALMAVLAAVMLAALRRQRAMPRPISLPEGVSIAPLARRVIGGLIDALPAIVGLFAMAWRYVQLFPTYGGETWKAMLDDPIFRWWGLGGSAIYLIHTLVAELFTHRSLGKMICGLRVADLNGDPPTAQAIVVRNVLRLIDVPMGALGAMGAVMDLVIMVYSPLRQRLGDIVARTLVVRGTPRLDEQTGQPIRKRQAPVDDGGEDEEGEPNEIRDCAGEQ